MLSVKATANEDFYKSTNNLFFHKKGNYPIRTEPYFKIAKIYVDLVSPKKYVTNVSRRKFFRSTIHMSPFSPCLGLGTSNDVPTDNVTKTIVRDETPQEYKIKLKPRPPNSEESKPLMERSLKELERKYWMVTTKRREDKPFCLPIEKTEIPDTTLEKNADLVRLRPHKRENETGDWQIAGNAWDHVQLRKNYYNPPHDCVQKIKNVEFRAKDEARRSAVPEQVPLKYHKQPFLMATLCKERQMPGYKGFIPVEPVQSTFEPLAQDHYSTVTKRIYRSFPLNALGDQKPLVRPAPMSRMVTLVPPNNPFKNFRCENRSGIICAK